MRIQIYIPSVAEITKNEHQILISRKGESWSTNQLGIFAKEKGVYIICYGGVIKYIGKTNGLAMNFGIRLRREFQETASMRRHIYPKLEKLASTAPITVSFITEKQINSYVKCIDWEASDYNKGEIFEQVLIQIYKPEFQKTF